MTAELTSLLHEDVGGEHIIDSELERMDTLVGSVINDVAAGEIYPGFTVTYDQDTNTAKWVHEYDTVEATASQRDGSSTFTLVRKLWDEAGYNLDTTTVSIVGSEARMTRSVVRNTGLVFEPQRTDPLDRATYDSTLGNLVDIKRLRAQVPEQRPARRPTSGWLRWFTRR